MELTIQAADIAAKLLHPLGDRWLHVQGVVAHAQSISAILAEADRPYLIAAAYLHDIGYALPLVETGFHPLDGARYVLLALGDQRLASLVAHHSGACFEARERGLAAEVAAFPRERSAVGDALDYCDLLTGPTGTPISLRERSQDIRARYGDDHIVTRAYLRALPYLALAVGRTRQRLAQQGISDATRATSEKQRQA
jgi:HD domain